VLTVPPTALTEGHLLREGKTSRPSICNGQALLSRGAILTVADRARALIIELRYGLPWYFAWEASSIESLSGPPTGSRVTSLVIPAAVLAERRDVQVIGLSDAWKSESIRTVPVNQSAGPLLDGCEPIRFISMVDSCV
jgi:hypothetical protein